MSAPRLRSLLGLLVVTAACFADEGLTGGTGSTTSGDTTEDATTSTSTTGTTSTSSTTSTSTSTTSTGGATTGTETCSLLGEPCGEGCCGSCLACVNGQCAANLGACGECSTCDKAGICVPRSKGTECQGEDPGCTAQVWGLEEVTCYAYAGAKGECDGLGGCVDLACAGRGEPIAFCLDARCLIGGSCIEGAAITDVSVETMCEIDEPTEQCGPSCSNLQDSSVAVDGKCGPGGECQMTGEMDCKGYVCSGDSCGNTCTNNLDCSANFACFDNQCVTL